jgi:RNA polymerase sigma-70 factor (sigma-E family)
VRATGTTYDGGRGMPDEAEFADFVHATGTQLFRTAVLLCGDHHLAEDLTQMTYAKMFAKWSTVRRADSPTAYARTTLLNTFLSHRRLRRSSERPVDDLPEGRHDDRDPTVRVDLIRALATLPSTDRAVLVLRYWEDRSVEETARALGMSSGAVRTRSGRALARLRDRLEPALLPTSARPGKEMSR